jgi:transcriptional regulator with XRE-family HTH domain
MDFASKIKALRIKYKLSQEEFADKIGVKRGSIGQIELGNAKPTLEMLPQIVKYFNISYEYFFEESVQLPDKAGVTEPVIKYLKGNPDKSVPLIPIDAFAGYTGDMTTVKELDLSERYVIPDFKGVDFMIRVRGNSMYPKYASGDVVACRVLKEWTFFQWGKVYVIDTEEQGVLVKRINKSQVKDSVLAISENKEVYEPFDLPRSSIRNIALVIGVVRLE